MHNLNREKTMLAPELKADLLPGQAREIPFLLIHSGPYRGSYANVPHGLGVLAAILEANGVPVAVRDYMAEAFSFEELAAQIRGRGIKVVGFSFMTPQAPWTYQVVEELRRLFPDLLLICGGAHPTFLPREPLSQGFRICFRRESEISLVRLLPLLVNGPLETSALKGIPGLAYLDNMGAYVSTGASSRVRDLDGVPWPARHLFPFPQNYPPQIPLVSGSCAQFFTSRGCPETCTFCAHPYRDGAVYYRSADDVVDEIQHVKETFGISHFYINDDNFCENRDRAIAISRLLVKRGIDLPWVCSFSRIDSADYEMYREMVKSGCLAVTFGIESGDPEVRKAIHKRGSINDAAGAVRTAQRAGLLVGATFVFGHFDETPEAAQRTIAFARKVCADYPAFFVNTPYPGSRDYSLFVKHGLFKTDDWADWWIQDNPIVRTLHFSTEELVRLKHRAFIAAYTNPLWWLRQTRNLFRLRNMGLGWRVLRNIVQEFLSRNHAPTTRTATIAPIDSAVAPPPPWAFHNGRTNRGEAK
jgi:anaerobic magnesium-protoporphyrin IX monomethyl ester cyclase